MSDRQNRMIAETQSPGADTPLSPQRAFVIQFRGPVEAELGDFAGRVEHIVSGRSTRFYCPEELLAFIERVLSDVEEKPP